MSPITRRRLLEGGSCAALTLALPGMPALVPSERSDLEERKAELIGVVLAMSDADAELAMQVCEALLRWKQEDTPESRWAAHCLAQLPDMGPASAR